ncbi:MAG: hypothetical protein U0694_13815, partial [Anaerolineae bacterium]
MLDSLDLNAIRQQVTRVGRRVKIVRWILGMVCLLIAVSGIGFLILTLFSPRQCTTCFLSLGVVLLLLALVSGFLLWVVTTTMRYFGFTSRAERFKLLQTLNLQDIPRPASSANIRIRLIYVGVLVIVGAGLLLLTRGISEPILNLAISVAVVILGIGLLGSFLLLPYYTQKRIYQLFLQNVNYEAALQETVRLRRRFPSQITYINLQGLVLGLMDRGADALQAYREFLGYVQRTPHPLYSVVALNNLGYEYVMAQRYNEALPLLETGAKIYPPQPHIYHTLALLYLEQNVQPERALELSEVAAEFVTRRQRDQRAAFLATQAWAAALTGRSTRAESLLNEAFRLANPKLQSTMAHLHLVAGRVKLALRDVPSAQANFAL